MSDNSVRRFDELCSAWWDDETIVVLRLCKDGGMVLMPLEERPMSDDIVERLRTQATFDTWEEFVAEAADEIERLRYAIEQWKIEEEEWKATEERLLAELERHKAVVEAAKAKAMELIREAHSEIKRADTTYGLALGAQKTTAEEILKPLRALDGPHEEEEDDG